MCLRLRYWIAQVCNPDAPDHRWIAKHGWRPDGTVKAPNSRAKENRRDVHADFVEETSILKITIATHRKASS